MTMKENKHLPVGGGRILRRRGQLVKGILCACVVGSWSVSSRLLRMLSGSRTDDVDISNQVINTGISEATSKNYGVRFVMFLGIEGTGHHMWQDLIKESPLLVRLEDLGLHPTYTKQLMTNLYRHKKNRAKGLWSATCKWNEENDPMPNITQIEVDLVQTLRGINRHALNQRNNHGQIRPHDDNHLVTFPVNLLPGGGNEFGVISFPGFLKPCRTLSYPNLDVFYEACEIAGVLCQHVYIYRNPYSVIRSTTQNRQFNKNKLEAIHLYTTQLRILHSQILQFHHKTIGCWDYDAASSQVQYREEVEAVLNFKGDSAYNDALQKIFNDPTKRLPLTKNEQTKIVPVELDSYMRSMITMHGIVVRTCQSLKSKI